MTDFEGGVSGLICGPPGTGKSTLLGSAGALGPTKLLAIKPRERNSWMYRKYGISADSELFADPKWMPSLNRYEASGYLSLLRRLEALQSDDKYDFVLIDPFTDVVTLAAHEILKMHKAATPSEIDGGSMGFYGGLRYKLKEITQAMTALQYAKRPKTVLVAVHTQQASEEDLKGKATQDKKAKHIEYEGDVLPMVEGGYRREIASEFDFVCFTFIRHARITATVGGKPTVTVKPEYGVQVQPNAERHAKNALGPMGTKEFFVDAATGSPLKAILDAVRESAA